MNYSILRDVISGAWQIDPVALNTLLPIYNGLVTGAAIEQQPEPSENIPFAVSAQSKQTMQLSVNESSSGDKRINVIPIRGIMTKHDQACGPVGMRTIAARMLEADADPDVIGHITINECPGGQSTAVPELQDAYAKLTKPVVGFIDGMAGSANYYQLINSDYIIASRDTDQVGCIGTMIKMNGRKAKSEANADGVVEVTIYAEGAEEKNGEYSEAINNFNFKPMQENVLNPLNEQFKADVRAKRPNVPDEQLKGRTFFASDVVGTLIDEIGPFSLAVDKVLELANYEPNQTQNSTNQNSNSIPMNKFTILTAALVAAGFATAAEMEMDADGQVTLSDEHLQAIEAALATNNTEELTTQLSEATQNLETANATIAERDVTITEQNEQITALKDGAGATTQTIIDDAAGSADSDDLSQADVDLFNQVKN